MRIDSSSMWPLIRRGDELNVRPVHSADLRPGDVLVVRKGKGFAVERLLRKAVDAGKPVLVTKGDNHFSIDRPVPLCDCVGKVLSVKRRQRTTDLQSLPWRCAAYPIVFLSSAQALVSQVLGSCKALFCR